MGFPSGRGFQAPPSAPRGPKESPRRSKRAPSRRLIGPRLPRSPPDGRRRSQDAQGGLEEASQEAPGGKNN
eukprot:4944386-Pyramimonas_sp.AAC.1